MFPSEKPFKHNIVNIGGGTFRPVNEIDVFEVYTGFELGAATGMYDNDSKNQYGNLYIQSNIGIRKPHFEIGGMVKIDGAYMNYRYPDFYDIIQQESFPVFSLRWGGMLRVGGENVNF